MKNLILTLIITLPLTLWGQGWEQTYGDVNFHSIGYSIIQTMDGGYIVSGISGNKILLLKIENDGSLEWSEEYGDEFEWSRGYSVKQTNDGGYIITGVSMSYSILIKTDVYGIEQWNQSFYYGQGFDVIELSDGGYVFTSVSEEELRLIKTDDFGLEIWNKIFVGTDENEGFNSVEQTSDGGYIITHTKENKITDNDILLIKTDVNGNEQWSKSYDYENDWDIGEEGNQTSDGGYILCGTVSSLSPFNTKISLIKTDINGNQQWINTYGDSDENRGYSVQQTSDGGYIITGGTYSSNKWKGYDLILIKTDENGNEQWTKTFGDNNDDIGFSVLQSSDNGYVVCGWYEEFNGTDRVYIIKTDDQGNITSNFEIPLPNPNRKIEKTVNLKGQEIKPQINQPIIEIFDDGSVEKKLIIEK